jgi:hypothetical protein
VCANASVLYAPMYAHVNSVHCALFIVKCALGMRYGCAPACLRACLRDCLRACSLARPHARNYAQCECDMNVRCSCGAAPRGLSRMYMPSRMHRTRMRVHVCMLAFWHARACVSACLRVCMSACLRVCVFVCLHECTRIVHVTGAFTYDARRYVRMRRIYTRGICMRPWVCILGCAIYDIDNTIYVIRYR